MKGRQHAQTDGNFSKEMESTEKETNGYARIENHNDEDFRVILSYANQPILSLYPQPSPLPNSS